VCASLMHVEIDLAFAFLRLAVSESYFEATTRAVEAVERAIFTHRTVMRHVQKMPRELHRERRGLESAAGKLLEAIVSAEGQFQILRGSFRREMVMAGSPRVKSIRWPITKGEAC